MPGWHEKLKDRDDVVQLGLIQEQHPDRCKLFMQWKQMDWPVMVDSLNLLGVKVVPITLFIDEHGVIRKVKPKHDDLEDFVSTAYPAPKRAVSKVHKPSSQSVLEGLKDVQPIGPEDPMKRRTAGDSTFLWLDDPHVAITWYSTVVRDERDDGDAHFRLGVAYRARHDSKDRRDDDFANAVKHWERSLEIDPNHYIRRRRIQQYGPRLDKPYSFYDWINKARDEIKARGETPVELTAEPGGAEFAYPDKEFKGDEGAANPDPDGKINRDEKGLIAVKAVPVPGKLNPGEASRIHVSFEVNAELKAHWNNETGDNTVWIDAPEGWKLDKQLLTLALGEGATSTEDRKIEFEVRAPEDAEPGEYTLNAYALYYVCEGVDGTCLYLRRDFEVTLTVRE